MHRVANTVKTQKCGTSSSGPTDRSVEVSSMVCAAGCVQRLCYTMVWLGHGPAAVDIM